MIDSLIVLATINSADGHICIKSKVGVTIASRSAIVDSIGVLDQCAVYKTCGCFDIKVIGELHVQYPVLLFVELAFAIAAQLGEQVPAVEL